MFEYLQGKTVLITGAGGFVGSHLVRRMLSHQAQVIAVDNYSTGRRENIADLIDGADNSTTANFRHIVADVTQPVSSYLPAEIVPDVVLHFASPASPPKYQKFPVETYLVNSLATHHLLSYLREHAPKARFVFASTSEVYGDPQVHPQTEDYWGNVNPNGVRSCYDESKRMGETICGVFHRDFGLDARIVRIFNTYGPHMDPADGRVIPNFAMQALQGLSLTMYGDGSFTRSYCYIDDLVEYITRMAVIAELAGETINIGNPTEYTVKETAEIVYQQALALLGKEAGAAPIEYLPRAVDDPTQRRPDISKAQRLLEYTPQIDLRTGLVKTLEYFKEIAATKA